MRVLKAVLYLTLSLCLLWGITVTFGATIIGFVLNRSFAEQQIRLTGLAISPKLEISASRAEFDFFANGQMMQGAVRAPKIKIYPTMNGWIVQGSSGLLQVNENIIMSSIKADFRTVSITNIYYGRFSFTAPELALGDEFEFDEINLLTDVNFSSSNISDVTFSAKTASVLNTQEGYSALADEIAGRLAKFSLLQD